MEINLYGDNDFVELLLRHLCRSEEVLQRAKTLKVTGEDFLAFGEITNVYQCVVDTILEVGKVPIDQELFITVLNSKLKANNVSDENIPELILFLYAGELNSEYFVSQLKGFISNRRLSKTKLLYDTDNQKLAEELYKIAVSISNEEKTEKALIVRPFEKVIKKTIYTYIGTGIQCIDAKIGGLSYGELGVIIGYSGGGKTCLSTLMSNRLAATCIKVAYISMEESVEDISNRLYSQAFRISYKSLRDGVGYAELDEKFDSEINSERIRLLRENLALFGLKGLSPLNCNQLHGVLTKYFEGYGFAPDVVFIDQLQFMEPNNGIQKGEQQWVMEQRTMREVDAFSHSTIGDKSFAVWINHQAKGKLRKKFTREDISGFKGIIHSPEIVLGIGREDEQSNNFQIFSIKIRHSGSFEHDFYGDLEYMTFTEQKPALQTGQARLELHQLNQDLLASLCKNQVQPT